MEDPRIGNTSTPKGNYPPPIKAVKQSSGIEQFSDISWAEFTNSRAAERIRILAIGDSFVEADHPDNRQAFHGLLDHAITSIVSKLQPQRYDQMATHSLNISCILHLPKKQLGAAKTYIVILIIPKDFSDAFFKGSGLKVGSYFAK